MPTSPSATSVIVLDRQHGIAIDTSAPPIPNYHALQQGYIGLRFLADQIRAKERELYNPKVESFLFAADGTTNATIACFFNWFAISAVNYFSLVALVGLMNKRGWKADALANPAFRSEIRSSCSTYVREVIPDVLVWRNKVAAHHAATDPFHDDNIATLQSSILDNVVYIGNYYKVGVVQLHSNGQQSELPEWALTQIYDNLTSRFWPELALAPLSDAI